MVLLKSNELDCIFVTSDHHFGHENIIRYCNRPFADIDEMDNAMVDKWNEVVGKDDIVYHLGDFTLGNIELAHRYFVSLNGRINILSYTWHHDRRWLPNGFGLLSQYTDRPGLDRVNICSPMVVLEIDMNETHPLAITLCHYPLRSWDRSHFNSWHLYGHTHSSDDNAFGGYCLNVGVDCLNFYPISLSSIMAIMLDKGWS